MIKKYRKIVMETGVTVVKVHNIPRNNRKTNRMTKSQELEHSPVVATVLFPPEVALKRLALTQVQSRNVCIKKTISRSDRVTVVKEAQRSTVVSLKKEIIA